MAELITPDLCVIGAGAGGLAAAEAAVALGASVAVVERDRPGGNRLYGGAVALRALGAAARRAHLMRGTTAFGISADARIQFRRIYEHIQDVVSSTAPRDSAQRLAAMGVTVVPGEGHFTDQRTLLAGDTAIRARHFIIATGSRPAVPEISGLETVPYFTSDTIFDNTRKLTHLLVIGAGPTGVEFAQAFARLGTKVTLVDTGTPLAGSDPELAAIVLGRLRDEGVDLLPDTEVAHIQARSQGIGVTVRTAGVEQRLDISHILVATGRKPNLETLDLAKAKIALTTDSGRLRLTSGLRTSNARVSAIGDVTGGEFSAQRAAFQADLVLRSALFRLPARNEPALVPRALYSDPGLVEIGLTEQMVRRRRGGGFSFLRAGFAENDRARVERDTQGLVKLVVDRSGRLLGAGIAGPEAVELGAVLSLALSSRLTVRQLADFAAPYPSYAAVLRQLAGQRVAADGPSVALQRLLKLNRLLP